MNEKMKQANDILRRYLKPSVYNQFKFPILNVLWENEEYVNNLIGFINFRNLCNNTNITESDIKLTIYHDIFGLINEEDLFLPRVSEYGKYIDCETREDIDLIIKN
tara:strand:- start:400 stop:717 length:318 start_codon:yes stop_codon:yes gene_type:complete